MWLAEVRESIARGSTGDVSRETSVLGVLLAGPIRVTPLVHGGPGGDALG